jgi:hypothetical protein
MLGNMRHARPAGYPSRLFDAVLYVGITAVPGAGFARIPPEFAQPVSAVPLFGPSQDNVRLERDQFRCMFAQLGGIACRPTHIDLHIAAVHPA